MGCWARVLLTFLALQPITALLPNKAAVGDLLPPLLQPIFKDICNQSVWCGQGTCQVSSDGIPGFVCNCNAGWTQFHVGDHLRFLPCIIPNCSVNYSCNKDSTDLAPSPTPLPHNTNFILSDPCLYSYCGGGTCVSTSSLKHRCECNEGFSNLFNQSSFPCYRDCSFGVDCANLGIPLTISSPPSLSNNTSSSDMPAPSSLVWMIPLAIPVILVA